MKQCPEIAGYRFERCDIKKCRMYTERTKHRCMAIDVKFSSERTINDKELRYYKFPMKSLKEVTAIRKAAVNRAQTVVALDGFIEELGEVAERSVGSMMPHKVGAAYRKVLDSKAFKIKLLRLKDTHIPYVFDRTVAEEMGSNLHQFSLASLFELTTTECRLLVDYFTRKGDVQGLF